MHTNIPVVIKPLLRVRLSPSKPQTLIMFMSEAANVKKTFIRQMLIQTTGLPLSYNGVSEVLTECITQFTTSD